MEKTPVQQAIESIVESLKEIKAIEKKEILSAFEAGRLNQLRQSPQTAEEYYKSKYNK